MGRIVSVLLPRDPRPDFPDRCLVCGGERPGASTRIISRDGLKGAALWSGWFSLRIPCCRGCAARLQIGRVWSVIKTLLIAGVALAFGILYLLPRYPGWATGLLVLGLIVVGFAIDFAWSRILPPPFAVDPHDEYVEYEFRDQLVGEEFARLNGATEDTRSGG